MLEWSCLQTCWYSGLEMLKTCFNRLKHVKTLKFDDVAVVGVKIQNSQKKMEKWWFQGVYVCMLLVMILCWGSMFHLHLWCFFRWGFGGNFDAKVMCQCLVFDEGDNCLGCWGLCFGSDEGDTVDTVLVVVAFWLSRYVLSFFGYDFIVFPYHQFQDRTFNLISFIRFHVFQHLSFFILSFSSFLVAFFLGCVLIWTSFASPLFCGLLHGLSGFCRGRPDEMCALFRLHGSITFEDILRFLRHYVHSMYTLWHYTTPRDVDCFLPQQTGSQMLTR